MRPAVTVEPSKLLGSVSARGKSKDKVLHGLDAVVTTGIVSLVVFTPLAIGSVEPWAYCIMEAVIFLLLTAWAAKTWLMDWPILPVKDAAFRVLAAPLALFIALVAFQLLPLPPGLERMVSPSTYEVYSKSLTGWPTRRPYGSLLLAHPALGKPATVLLPSKHQVEKGTVVPFAPAAPDSGTRALQEKASGREAETAAPAAPQGRQGLLAFPDLNWHWRPLSLAPSLTGEALLRLLAYTGLFFLVLLYPFGASQRDREKILHRIVLAVLCAGLLVAAIGLVERATWNGKILWFFRPYDWGEAGPVGMPRASGPFVNPDHFANYLALVFPLALVGTMFPGYFGPKSSRGARRLFCGVTALILFAAILASLSRAGWISAALGLLLCVWLLTSMPAETKPLFLRQHARAKIIGAALGGFLLVLALALVLVGPAGRTQADLRLKQSVGEESNYHRLPMWRSSLGIIGDFPFFGVGLGCWSDIFPRYKSAPWSPDFPNAAHNDYLQLATETGLLGFLVLAWAVAAGVKTLHRQWRSAAARRSLPVVAALVAGLAVAGFHEFVDFPLQIPANALLFTLFFALALRLVGAADAEGAFKRQRRTGICALVAGTAAFLVFIALGQDKVPYPYDVGRPKSPAALRDLILAHPASSRAHLMLVDLMGGRLSPAARLEEFKAALWLEPTNPFARDLYAQTLFHQHQSSAALRQITKAVFFSPSLDTHFYLAPRFIPRLSGAERKAVVDGFNMAIAHKYVGAVDALGGFYYAAGRFADEGRVYSGAAAAAADPAAREDYLLAAGAAYGRAGDYAEAEAALRGAMLAEPADLTSYEYLIKFVFTPRKDLAGAQALVKQGIAAGADPYGLNLSLAEIAQSVGDMKAARNALEQAHAVRPSGFDAVWQLGGLYLAARQFAQAIPWLRKAAGIRPDSADVFYNLARAEELDYDYAGADKAYARAVGLAPQNQEFKLQYEQFKRNLSQSDRNSD